MKNSQTDDLRLDFSIDAPVITEPEMPESFEEATKEEISDVLKAFRNMANHEAELKAKNVSTDFWFAVYFASQDQRDTFLRAVKLLEKLEDQYIDGTTFAKALGVEVPVEEISIPKTFRKPANIDDLILEL